MLAKKRSLKLSGQEVERTPVLVPSFSSKGFPEVDKIIKYSSELIDGPALVSAYDLYYQHIAPPFEFASLLFLDSGGYEASKDVELSDYGNKAHAPKEWKREFHESVLQGWEAKVPSVLISYDHPRERFPVRDQIARAREMTAAGKTCLKEILLKPQTITQARLDIEEVIKCVHGLSEFDVIGVTEKEIGSSLLERMKHIGMLRTALTNAGLDIPIHVFGSLDTVSSPLYFLAGADIFDGLTWLRFAYQDGRTVYKQNYGASVGISIKAHVLDGLCWENNYRYLQEMTLDMRRFLQTEDFASFKHNAELFRNAYNSAVEAIGATNGRE